MATLTDTMRAWADAIRAWDWAAIFYSLAGSALLAVILRWLGLFRAIRTRLRYRKGIRTYIKTLRDECSSLIVVGRRKGFSLDDVFIPLDIAPSDLMAKEDRGADVDLPYPDTSFVLLGPPGAGKSTLAKRAVLHQLDQGSLPFFIRLREHSTNEPLESLIVRKLRHAGIPNPEDTLHRQLGSGRCYCVLDGLDEVRPKLREDLHRDINRFYATYFVGHPHARLTVTCRKEAYRTIPLDIQDVWEVRPLTDEQLKRFTEKWPPGFPAGKTAQTFLRDLNATPRVHELARSPLLLVGGLMQYTESNLGIPEERVEYLSRVARWLVVDWATAQGHPPDPYRQVYDRLLPRIALHLHRNQKTDCPRTEAERLVTKWLPTLGHPETDAITILEQIATKTGILVTDDQNAVVFAQFGLQEYYASLELLSQFKIEQVGALEPKPWWREAILLAAAQQREPTPILEGLFVHDALLAAAAVAECATPATVLQERAVEACLSAVDATDRSVGPALVSLLRKVRDPLEGALCHALEKRLGSGAEKAKLVGQALATAGTERATAALARHPEAWEACLKDAGYLSASFENLLVDLIQKGDDQQSERAADLLALRLSNDRFRQLIALLPSMPEDRSDRLASLLIRHAEARFDGLGYFPAHFYADDSSLWILGSCVPYIRQRERYLAKRRSRTGRGHHRYPGDADAVAVALFMESRGRRFAAEKVLQHLMNCLTWSRQRASLLTWAAGAILLLIVLQPTSPILVLLIAVATLLSLFAAMRPTASLPWLDRMYYIRDRLPPSSGPFLLVLGSTLAICMGARVDPMPVPLSRTIAGATGALLLLIMGIVLRQGWPPHSLRRQYALEVDANPRRFGSAPSQLVSMAFCAAALVSTMVYVGTRMAAAATIVGAVAGGWVLWCGYCASVLLRSVYLVSQARQKAMAVLAETLK